MHNDTQAHAHMSKHTNSLCDLTEVGVWRGQQVYQELDAPQVAHAVLDHHVARGQQAERSGCCCLRGGLHVRAQQAHLLCKQ